jgi:membrane-associated phospholipid phosphatase
LGSLLRPWPLCLGLFLAQPAAAAGTVELAGDALQLLIPGLGYGATFYMDDREGRMQFYKSFAANLIVTHGLKYTVDKKRPNGSDKSFPSGHTSAAFQGAAFIHRRYGLRYAIPAYVGASFVGYSRVESDNHYVEDVIAGALIGMASSFYFTQAYNGVTVSAFVENGVYGIRMHKNW